MSTAALPLTFATAPSPVGPILFALHGESICALYFGNFEHKLRKQLSQHFGDRALESTVHAHDSKAADSRAAQAELPAPIRGAIDHVRAALARYFAGDLDALDSLPRDPHGTEFQRRVWDALCTIPAGETRSYAQIAEQVGSPKGMRAVGLANGKNPISLAVPCHRVIGADGSLTGYGGGMDRKRWLLAHERVRSFTGGFEFNEK